jgi:anti-sigma factor RsiW
MSDQWMDRLSEYLDDELDQPQRIALEAHLAECAACTATLADLRRVVGRAHALGDRPPATDLWPGIATRIGVSTDDLARRRALRRVSFTVPQLIAASIVLVAATVVVARFVARSTSAPAPVATATPAPTTQAQPVAWPARADSSGDLAVAQLQLALREGQRTGRISPITVQKLEHSLAVIDSAIAEARRALDVDPNSSYLNHHLADTMRLKMEFLREANRIATART